MLKKNLFYASVAALGLMMGACSNDIDAPMPEGDGTVTFTAQLPANVQSRYGEGQSATQLRYAVYEANTTNVIFTSEVAEDLTKGPDATYNNLTFTLKLNLVKGKTYDLVFWAQNPTTDAYEFSPKDQTIKVKYEGITGNDEARDAFFNKVQGLVVKGAMQKSIELYRPFAQLNIATRDLEAAEAAGVKHKATSVKVSDVPTVLDLVTGATSGTGEMTVPMHTRAAEAPTTIFEDDNTTVKAQYHYLSMNYILTGTVIPDKEKVNEAQKENKDVTITFNDSNDQAINTFKMSAVPFQRNYRTNIYGALLTSEVDYTIEIKPGFTGPSYDLDATNVPIFVRDENNNVVCVNPELPDGVTAESFVVNNAGAVCLNADGDAQYFPPTSKGLLDAMLVADEIYLAPNSVITTKSHEAKIPANGIKIHGNGATLTGQESDFALSYTKFVAGSEVDIYIENLNNARVWGDADVACTLNITFDNCTFIGGAYGSNTYGLGLLMLRGKSLATHNIVLKDCYCEGVQVGMHSANAGNFNFTDCTFKGVGIPVNIAKKGTEPSTVNIENCTFVDCGLEENGTDAAWDYAAPIRVVDNAGSDNSMKVNIVNTSIVGRLGSYDVLLIDYRAGKVSYKVAYEIINSGDLVVRDE